VGNDTAVDAARAGETGPWPEGTTIAHYQWAPGTTPESGDAVTPGNFVALTMMTKNTELYAADHNWAFGVWRGVDLVPPAVAEPAFDRVCVECHTSSLAPEKDFIFTVPGALPSSAAVTAAPALSNGLEVPGGILDWRVIGAASLATAMPPTIRVILGNDTAVAAARAGDTNPWPNGSILAQYVWTAGETPDVPAPLVSATEFAAFTLMVRDSDAYAADGGWAYGRWNGTSLTAPAAADFDRACVACHTERVAANDFVFTRPGALPPSFVSPD
jgi:Cytochrome P460